MSSLEQLKATGTVVVTDTGEFDLIAKYKPQDATTNPSLILQAASKPEYSRLINDAVAEVKSLPEFTNSSADEKAQEALDRLLVEFGSRILDIVPGRVSTEVDARLSFDVEGTVAKALKIIKMYGNKGYHKDRILIKIASTYEGIQAAQILEKEHQVHCNLTLLFSEVQAIAAAEAGATLISPFVGRILDWHKKATGKTYSGAEDPGVKSVQSIYNYYKKYGHKTIVMGASFRNVDEIKELAGIDFLTISPKLLEELYSSKDPVPKKLDAKDAKSLDIPQKTYLDRRSEFLFELNQNAMALEKLAEGIRNFVSDTDKLLSLIASRF